ncbi:MULTISPECIES: acyl-CoA synthetase [unclassified Colwellia]|jgi:acetyl-CoA synthetase|uniref:AMP-binding enzyme n=1 Tax=unclassified Colwellia TaxID=196834 RepID=UPI000D348C36|nr:MULTISPECIES: acyl-CoA synthetase [unclassified Colwellia]AWB59365.1 hypothetical protein DBO93_18525 [Colwellia sp. Arc7-D]MBA6417617.1 acyl-CoA synthetase [Colwellia sp. 6M3]|tara:strand:+ start:2053 stop:2541 length:489 start_codon:yes stop_codon:yes gene_type:complete
MSNLLNQSVESAPLSWLQSNSGEWQYFVDKVLVDESSSSVFTQDYIWLVSQAITSHKVSGYRIANQTMENFIEQLAGVEQAIVFGVPHEHKGNALHVYIELTHSGIEKTTLSNAINAKLAGGVGEFARADVITFVEKLPVDQNKRISRKTLKSQCITVKYAA